MQAVKELLGPVIVHGGPYQNNIDTDVQFPIPFEEIYSLKTC